MPLNVVYKHYSDHRTRVWRTAHCWHVAHHVLVNQYSWRKKALICSTCQFHGVNIPTTAIFQLPTVDTAHKILENVAICSNEPTQKCQHTIAYSTPLHGWGEKKYKLIVHMNFPVFRYNDFTSDEKKKRIVLEMGKLGSNLNLLRSNIFIS